MKVESGLLAAGLAAATLAAGCGQDGATQSTHEVSPSSSRLSHGPHNIDNAYARRGLHVGEDRWVRLRKTARVANAGGTAELEKGADCVIARGAKLAIRGGDVFYEISDGGGGTECPNGSEITLSVKSAKAQNREYLSFLRRKQNVADQLAAMHEVEDDPVKITAHWVDVVNPKPVSNANVTFQYGSSCIPVGQTFAIGHFSTGEAVIMVQNSQAAGTECPNGTLFLER